MINRDQIKNIAQIVESVISKRLNESDNKQNILNFANKNLVTISTPAKYTDYKRPKRKIDIFKLTLINSKNIGGDEISVYGSRGDQDYVEINDEIFELTNLPSWANESKINESAVAPFQNKREAIFAIEDVISGTMTQKNFINQLAAAKRAKTIDEKNFKLMLGQLRVDAQRAGVKLEPIIDRLIDKYHTGSDVFNPNLGESKKINENMSGHIKNQGNDIYVDSNFINSSQNVLPNSELKHMGFGEFYLKTREGDIQFARTGEKIEGFVGRAHKIYDDVGGNLVKQLIDKMVQSGKAVSESRRLRETSRQDSGMGSSIAKRRAESELKQKLKGKRSDGLGPYTATIYGLDKSGKRVELKSLNDLNKFTQFELDESRRLREAPVPIVPARPAPVAAKPVAPVAKPAAPIAPAAAPVAPQAVGVDPAWKLDMVEFLGNTFGGMAKQFLYQAKKSNPNASAEQISALAEDLQTSGQVSELFKSRFLSALAASA